MALSAKDEFFAIVVGVTGQSVLKVFNCNVRVDGGFSASDFDIVAELDQPLLVDALFSDFHENFEVFIGKAGEYEVQH